MRISLGGAVEVDLATTEDIGGMMDGAVDKVIGAIPRRKRKPLLRRIPASQQTTANVPTVLDFGTVPAGYTYEITHCVVVGADDFTVLAGATAALYIGNPANFALGDIVQPGIPVPGYWNIGQATMYSHFGANVFVVVRGAAGAVNVSGVLSVTQHSEDTVEARGM